MSDHPDTLPPQQQYRYWFKRFCVSSALTAAAAALTIVFTSAAADVCDSALSRDSELEQSGNTMVNVTRGFGAGATALCLMFALGHRRKMLKAWDKTPR
jgi:hypothetical protein